MNVDDGDDLHNYKPFYNMRRDKVTVLKDLSAS